jgi:hypothetical protein
MAVRRTAINNFQLLHIKKHDLITLLCIGVYMNEKMIKMTPDINAPHIPSQKTAFYTLTSYFRNIVSS